MDEVKINGVILTPLKIIENEKGDIYHSLKATDNGYVSFGEAYFSTVKKDIIKAWKKHFQMTLNLTVPVGAVKFVLYDDRSGSATYGVIDEIELSLKNYYRLTIPPNIWLGFQGLSEGLNLLLNIASIPHDPAEQINVSYNELDIPYKWS